MESVSRIIDNKIKEAKKLAAIYPPKSYDLSIEAYKLAKEYNLKSEEGYSLISLAFVCRAKSDNNLMLEYSFRAHEIFEETNDLLGQIKSLNLIGVAYFYGSMYEEALIYFLKAEDLLNLHKDDFLLSCVFNNIGEVYRETCCYDKALQYFDRAYQISIDNNYNLNVASILINIGEINFAENKYEEASEKIEKSYKIFINENDMINLGEAENKIGKIYYSLKNFDKAEKYYFRSLNRLYKVNNKYYTVDVLVNLAKLYMHKDHSQSIYYYEKAMEYAENIDAKKKLVEIYKLVSEYYEYVEDYKKALEYYKSYSSLNEEITASNIGKKLEILQLELKFTKDIDKFDRVRELLEKEIEHQGKELEKIRKSNELLIKKAYEDELTTVPNRRYINNSLNEVWHQMMNDNENITLLMIDIDDFKRYNDCWGHPKGDECLKLISNKIKKIQEERHDVFGRYGGEEFVYYAKNLDYNQSLNLANYIRTEVENLNINYKYENTAKNITVSIGGVTGKVKDIEEISNLIVMADKELYKAKDLGRNKVCLISK